MRSTRLVRQGRRVLLQASTRSARATAPVRMRPSFLIVGGQRCGTTSMFKTLVQHRAVAKPFLRKGVHYFDKHYEKGEGWYQGHFPVAATSRLRRRGGVSITGESSPYYMFHPLAGARIAADLPGVRLIALVRDPVERAYSAHSHERARGYEDQPFERALELESERTDGERERMLADPAFDSFALQHHAYLARGRYHEHLSRLSDLVGRERLHVVDSHDFFTDPHQAFGEVLDFLGLPWQDGIAFEQHNSRTRAAMPEGLRTRLEDHFAPYDEDLRQWWGRTPSWRR